jgi:alkylation response protein AidB-like acyl-CoA dehydrogenase
VDCVCGGSIQFELNDEQHALREAAHLYTVFATLDLASRHEGICAFIVPVDLPGISRGKREDKLGQRASDTCSIHFDGIRVPESQRLAIARELFRD